MHWTAVFSTLEVIYVIALGTWIVLEKRSPVATLAWILSLAAIPYVGFVVYFLIGPRRLTRKRIRHARSRASVRAELEREASKHPEGLTAPFRVQMATLAARSGGSVLATAKEVTILESGAMCFDALEEAIRAATHHIHLEYYIFEQDITGERIRDALVERAKAGVVVRLLVDGVGTSLSRSFLRPLREAGGQFARFNPPRVGRLLPRINMRNHRKIVVCDGRVGFLGGINVGDEYTEKVTKKEAYRDTHMRVVGGAVRELQFAFLEDWNFATSEVVRDKGLFPEPGDDEQDVVQIIPSGPDHEWEAIQHVFFTFITQAEDRIHLTTPYFVPDDAIRVALCTAALRGVDVQILVPHVSDSRVVSAAARSYYDELLRAGAQIFEYPKMIHAKTLAVDGKVACVGSANMDNRSFRLNFEINAVVYSEEAVAHLERLFKHDKRHSRHVTLKSRGKLDMLARLGEASARLLSPLL